MLAQSWIVFLPAIAAASFEQAESKIVPVERSGSSGKSLNVCLLPAKCNEKSTYKHIMDVFGAIITIISGGSGSTRMFSQGSNASAFRLLPSLLIQQPAGCQPVFILLQPSVHPSIHPTGRPSNPPSSQPNNHSCCEIHFHTRQSRLRNHFLSLSLSLSARPSQPAKLHVVSLIIFKLAASIGIVVCLCDKTTTGKKMK